MLRLIRHCSLRGVKKLNGYNHNLGNNSLLKAYNRAPIWFTKGRGSWLETVDGKMYLDLGAGIAVNSLGHSSPILIDALNTQSNLLWHTSNLYNIPVQEELAQKITDNTFADKVFFTNSGTESIECAIKMARRYQHHRGFRNKIEILTLEGAFHGRSMSAISASGSSKLTNGFEPILPGFKSIPFANLDSIESEVTEKTCAVLLEPIQGEGGIKEIPIKMLNKVRAICDKHDALLIFDEVQSGIGRTGKFFAYEYSQIEPDIVAIAKGIGGGFPLGCCLASEKASSGIKIGTHGSTFGGNPLACAVGLAVINEILSDQFLPEVIRKGKVFKAFLQDLVNKNSDIFHSVSGKGLMLGLKCNIQNSQIIEAAYKHLLLLVPAADNVVRVLPALNISDDDIAEARTKLEKVVYEVRK